MAESSRAEVAETYEKTILWLASEYSNRPLFHLSEADYSGFASFLCVDEQALRDHLIPELDAVSDNNLQLLFLLILKAFFAGRTLKQLWHNAGKTDNAGLLASYNALKDYSYWMSGMNADASVFVCLEKQELSWDYALQNWSHYYPLRLLDSILLYQKGAPLSDYRANVPLLIKSVTYDMRTRVNALYVVNILLVIQYSPFLFQGNQNRGDCIVLLPAFNASQQSPNWAANQLQAPHGPCRWAWQRR